MRGREENVGKRTGNETREEWGNEEERRRWMEWKGGSKFLVREQITSRGHKAGKRK